MGKEKIIPLFAILLLIVASTSAAYVYTSQVEKVTITLNSQEYTIDQLFLLSELKTIQTIEGQKIGISIESLINNIGIECPSCYNYTIMGKDGYQQTVEWDIMKTGILTEFKRIYFPDTPKKFWVRDIVEIEVD